MKLALIYITKNKELIKTRISSYVKRSLKDLKEILEKELRPNESDENDRFRNPKIAQRIENSIKKVLDRVGIQEEEITTNTSWGSFKSRYLDVINHKSFYNMLYSTGSSSIHGNFDLVFKYYTDGNIKSGFSLKDYSLKNDFRIISGIQNGNMILIVHLVELFFQSEEVKELKDLIITSGIVGGELAMMDEKLLP